MVPMIAGSKAPGLSDALARVHKVGLIIWAKRTAGVSVPWRERIAGSWWPRSSSSCPRPMTATWCSLSIGSQFTVLSSTYYPMVFVVDRDSLWMLPPVLQHAKAELCPGCPGTVLRRRRAAGAPGRDVGKTLTFTAYLEMGGRKREIDMDLPPFYFQKKRFFSLTLCRTQPVTGPCRWRNRWPFPPALDFLALCLPT